jgi:hypothetical protein
MGLDGVEIFTNSSGSHHELRKLHRRIDLIKEATQKVSSPFVLPIWCLNFRSLGVFICTRTNKDVTEIDSTMTDVQ